MDIVFMTLKKEQDERDSFYQQLYNVVEKLKECRPQNWRKPETVVQGSGKKICTISELEVY